MRGRQAPNGATRVAPNGYHYTKENDKWMLTHHLVARETLGRLPSSEERVTFKDGDRTNLSPDNIVVSRKVGKSGKARLAQLQAKVEDLQAQIAELESQE